ncbi:hypothetical protein [Microbacterium sp. OR16]|uniref:arsenate reductase/protein-tyrosine-phosphatase family protein n=1 Tax=Microbacterium sp. OR16 TaxID=3095345 RepID=UPI0039B3C229
MIARVLFVCAQNVCRSPLMAASFAAAVGAGRSDDDDWVVRSAGTHAHTGQFACPVAVEFAEGAAGHRSAPVDMMGILLADLVIVASREERSWIAQEVPESRQTTFTLREALLLDERVRRRGAAGAVSEYVAALNAHRGTIDLTEPSPSLWRREPEHPLDIRDVHGASRRAHRRVLADAAREAAEFGQRMREALLIPA